MGYTRPNVGRLRDSYPDLSWLMAFLLVLKAGNELPILTSEDTGCRKLLCCKNLSNIRNNSRNGSDDESRSFTGDDVYLGSTEITSIWNDTFELESEKNNDSDL